MPRTLDNPKIYAKDGTARPSGRYDAEDIAAQACRMLFLPPSTYVLPPRGIRPSSRRPLSTSRSLLDDITARSSSIRRMTDAERRRAEQIPIRQAA